MSHTENEFLRKIAEQGSGIVLSKREKSKPQELEPVSGEIEPTEVMYFGQTNSIQDIIDILKNLPDDALKKSSGKSIDKNEVINLVGSVKQFLEAGEIVPGMLLSLVTREQGLRLAVIREIVKFREQFFSSANNLDQIIKNLENIIMQNSTFRELSIGEITLKDSDKKPVDMQGYIDDLKYTKNWLAQNPGRPLENSFYKKFTGNHGIREAIMRATGK